MHEKIVPSSPRSEILRILAPLAALASMASFAAREADPAGAAESACLAMMAVAALLPAGFLAPWPAYEVGIGSTLAAAAVWALPPGPGRGAALMVLLVSTLAVTAGRALHSRFSGGEWGREVSLLVPLALGAQALLRGGLLFAPPSPFRLAVALVALPVAAGLALSVLARRHGMALALIAGGTAAVLAPGFNMASTLGLIALAAGSVLTSDKTGPGGKVLAWIALLAPLAWAPAPGAVAVVCGLALRRPRIAIGLAAVMMAGLVWYFHPSMPGIARQAVWLFLLVPAAILPGRERIAAVLTALLLAGTLPPVPGAAALAAPMALAALSLRRDAAFLVPQGVWTGAMAAGTALLSGYPWLRAEPMPAYLALFGLAPGPALAVVVVCVALVLTGLGIWMGRGWGEPLRSVRLTGLAAACLVLGLLVGLPDFGTPLLAPAVPVVLDAGHPVWESPVSGHAVRSVVVESSLSNGAGLAPGTPVAIVSLRHPEGTGANWVLRAGEGTGEWAARRPDVAHAGVKAPGPWVSWVAGELFLGQRYRARWTLERPESVSSLRIERAPGVPPDLAVAVYQLEIRR
jgi:hypothetical protein